METAIELLLAGDTSEKKDVLKNMNKAFVKMLLNVIYNVVNGSEVTIRPNQRRILKRYNNVYKTLLNKKISLNRKVQLLRRDGHVYLPVFLDIIGSDIEHLLPRSSTYIRKRQSCRICRKENLVKISNHLAQVHHLSREERLKYHGLRKADDTGDEDSASDGSQEGD